MFGMGVADGVYMWKEQGIDSGAMSRALMESAQHMVQAGCEDVLKGVCAVCVMMACVCVWGGGFYDHSSLQTVAATLSTPTPQHTIFKPTHSPASCGAPCSK